MEIEFLKAYRVSKDKETDTEPSVLISKHQYFWSKTNAKDKYYRCKERAKNGNAGCKASINLSGNNEFKKINGK